MSGLLRTDAATLTWTLEKMQSFSLGGLAQPPGLAGVEPARRMINRNRLYASKDGHILSYKRSIYKSTFEVRESVEIYDDHFAPDAKDEVWLAEVGSHEWIILTKDDRIRYRVTERTTLASARVRAFVLTSTQLQGSEMAAAFVRALPRIKRLIANHAPPFIGRVSRDGKVSLL
jgi:PIN like domain